MKEFWKSVSIWQSYCHEFGGPVFFGTQCRLTVIPEKHFRKLNWQRLADLAGLCAIKFTWPGWKIQELQWCILSQKFLLTMIHLNRLVDVSYVIFALWFLSKLIYLSFSSPNLSARLPYFHTWCGLSANLECMSEMCGMRLAANTGRKKIAILAPSHNFVGLYLRS